MAASPARRRQRSVRVSVAVALMVVATVAVLAALATRSVPVLSAAAVLVLLLGWAALRITWTEVLQSRRDNALDRVATAQAYRSLFSERAAEHAEFTTAMTERLAESQLTMRELQALLVQEQLRAASAESRLGSTARGLGEATARVAELEQELARRAAEEEAAAADALASWEADGGGLSDDPRAADLAAFEEKVTASVTARTADARTA
ncbi:MAG: hypothetical protein ACTHNS_05090 [Marmoricola sp.]